MASSGYTLLEIPRPRQRLVHVLTGAEELGRVYQPELKIQAGLNAFAAVAAQLVGADSAGRRDWLEAARADYLAYIEPPARETRFDPALAIKAMQDILSPDAIITNGAGNYSAWAHRYHQFSHPASQLAPTSGAMGYGVPAAIAARLCHPSRQVICLAGDGCFLMTSQELATAVRHRLAIVFIIFNNRMYATIRMHQEKHYPARVIATDLSNPDFVAYARSFGVEAHSVTESAEFAPALQQALASASAKSSPFLIEIQLDTEILTPRTTLSALRRLSLPEVV
jgi:acetolactate synthase-1/2/3 large subunit